MEEHEKLAQAKRQVEAITGFYIHLSVFAIVMVFLFGVNLLTSKSWWAYWPFLGWGVGVIGHAWAVFGETPAFIRQWQSRKVEEIKTKL